MKEEYHLKLMMDKRRYLLSNAVAEQIMKFLRTIFELQLLQELEREATISTKNEAENSCLILQQILLD